MAIPYSHLRFALAQLGYAHYQLNKALELAKAQDYGPNWVAAIEKACAQNDETDRQVGNILVNIHPRQ